MSQSTIEAALRTLLMEEGRACLPGIGTLVVEAQPALISLMEGRASPPSKYVTFNANLLTDDGRLRQESGGDRAAVDSYLQHIEATLRQDQPFLLPGIGKLYRQDDTIRFTPGANNLSKGSYGLPTVDVQPIIRKERVGPGAQAASTSRRDRRAPARPSKPRTTDARRPTPWPWYLAAVVGVLLTIVLVLRLAGTIGDLPKKEREEEPPPTAAENVVPQPPPALAEPIQLPPDNEAIIYIGLFARERNVRKQVGRLEAAGYVPYTEREGRNTRVGLRLRYHTDAELRRALTDVRNRFTPEAFISRVNGAERRPQ